MGFIKDFKAFAIKGNVVDLAVAVIIGTEFGKIVNSLVNDIVMPPFGMVLNDSNFPSLFISLDGEQYESLAIARELGAPVLAYGSFIQQVVNFIIIAFCIFLFVSLLHKLRRKPEKTPAPPDEHTLLLREIRDALKKGS